jgi:hypothetical protein
MQSVGFDTAARTHWQSEDVLSVQNELERGAPFCANSSCDLHVRLVDLQVEGGGNWVTLPDGRTFGRGRYGVRMLCDACGTRRGPVRLVTAEALAHPPVQDRQRSA